MGIFVRPNYKALVEYLDRYGIDANRVREKGMNENGYEYVAQFPNGRPVYHDGYQLTFNWVTWPSKTVYENVVMLQNGGDLRDIKEDELIEEEQPKEVDDPEPTVEEKQEAPVQIKVAAKRGRPRK